MVWENFAVSCGLYGATANIIAHNVVISGGKDGEGSANPSGFTLLKGGTKDVLFSSLPNNPCFYEHAACMSLRRSVYITGGNEEANNIVYEYIPEKDQMEVHTTTGAALANRSGASMSLDVKKKTLCLFGGSINQHTFSNDMFFINTENYSCTVVTKTAIWPPEVAFHTASFIRGKIYVFGGQTKHGSSKELWSWDLETEKWTLIECSGDIPSERYKHGAVVIGKMILIAGGRNDFGLLEDTYVLNTETCVWRKLPSSLQLPCPSDNVSIVLLPKSVIVLSPYGCWTISPRLLIGSPECDSDNIVMPRERLFTMKEQIDRVMALLESTTEKYSQIEELLEMESLCISIHQILEEYQPPSKVERHSPANRSLPVKPSIPARKLPPKPNSPKPQSAPSITKAHSSANWDTTKPRLQRTQSVLSRSREKANSADAPKTPPPRAKPPPPVRRNHASSDPSSSDEKPRSDTSPLAQFASKSLPAPPASPNRPKCLPNRPQKSPLVSSDSNISETFYKSGAVWKRKITKKVRSNWKFRYFNLRQNVIYYYHTEFDGVPLGQVDMKTARVRRIRPTDEHIKDNRKWCMEFTTPESVYHIAVDTEQDLNDWLDLLRKVEDKYYDARAINNGKKRTKGSTIRKSFFPKKSTQNVEIGAPSGNSFAIRKEETQPQQGSTSSLQSSTPRGAILNEILSTERDYVADLVIITDFYIRRLEDFKILKKTSKDVIFANIEDLVPLHQSFLQKLEEEFKNEDPSISKIFISEAPKWSAYSHFCTSQSNSKEAIERYCSENNSFAMCLEELRQQPEARRLDLASYLIKPMQRLCKYPLLLRELQRETPETHPESTDIVTAIDIVSEVLKQVNENKRTADNVVQLLQLQETIPDYNLNMHKKGQCVIKQQEFKKVQYDSNKEACKCAIWLLSDVFIVAKKVSKGKYSFRVELPVENIIVWDLDPNGTASETKNAFSVFRTDTKNIKVVISANNAAEKMEWMEVLNNQIAQTGFVTK